MGHIRNFPRRPTGHTFGRQLTVGQALPDATLTAIAAAVDKLNSTQSVPHAAQVATITTQVGTVLHLSSVQSVPQAAQVANASTSVTSLAWQIPDQQTLASVKSNALTLATSAPSGGTAYPSPDLLPGETLQYVGTNINLVADATLPTVDAISGPTIDAVAARDIVIEVMDSQLATIVNATQSISYPWASNRWNNVLAAAANGDVIEISPGAVFASDTDGAFNNFYFNIKGTYLNVSKDLTVRNMAGRGRWRVLPVGATPGLFSGAIGIYGPTDAGRRLTVTLEGFDIVDQSGLGPGVLLVRDTKVDGSLTWMILSATMRNFKAGKTTGTSESGFNGIAETLLIEDACVFDYGGANPGQDHNMYLTAYTMTMRGLRSYRSRVLDGHILKLAAVNMLIEGCAIECFGAGDSTHAIQCKGGGNLVVRGCLLIDGPNTQGGRGPIAFVKELAADGVTPNFEWFASIEGNSMLVEKNVFIRHAATGGCVFFFPSSNGSYIPGAQISSINIRDNIGMVIGNAPAGWIMNDPKAGPAWSVNNSVETYDVNETPFANRPLKIYTRAAGTLAAGAGSVAAKQFVWPHGYIARTDAFRGLA